MLLGEQVILPQEILEPTSGIMAAYGPRIWVTLAAANTVPLRVSTTREKSLELQIPKNRSFHLSGRRRAAFGAIPLLPGDNCGQAFGINKSGHVVGYSSGPNGRKAFLWTQSTGVHNLGVLPGGNYSTACDINDLDEVAGTSASAAGDRAVLWTKTGNVRDLGTLPGDTSSEATAINNNGDVVGYSKGPRGMRAFFWTQATGMQDLGVLPGGNSSRALGINDKGTVVGSSTGSSGDRAFIWTKEGGMRDLTSAASVNLGVVFVEAHAINNRGQILVMGGATHQSSGSGHAALGCAPAPPSSFLLTPASK